MRILLVLCSDETISEWVIFSLELVLTYIFELLAVTCKGIVVNVEICISNRQSVTSFIICKIGKGRRTSKAFLDQALKILQKMMRLIRIEPDGTNAVFQGDTNVFLVVVNQKGGLL